MVSKKGVLFILAFLGTAIIIGVVILFQSFLSDSSVYRITISEIASDPAAWENKIVRVDGTMQTPALGIILPFNYWLYDTENHTMRIGVKWTSETDLSGKNLTIVGAVRKDYAWVHPDYPGWRVYFIEASSIYEMP
ncbi:MAG: hypothetical protein QHH18_04035 [Candidatus Bathyarchaeota archaeon]|jgi:hypothetical protein|nr:hypothetical protein [Candidatus Bathyarchaeota archaeon A05DMB-5]MDH7557760.1 hypothetical protein [Candidatus Bathyarchaeota archaeon]